MKSKILFFNKGIIFDDIRRFGWIGIAYALALFFIVPLKILMLYENEQVAKDVIKGIFCFRNTEFQGFLVIGVPVLLAIFLFRYMQVKVSADMIHSLPIKRDTLYRTHVFIGILILVIPVVIVGAISASLNITLGLDHYYNIYDVIQWTQITVLMDLVFFFTCIFVGMLVGSSVLQGGLTYILLFLPLGLTMLLAENLYIFIYGFTGNIEQQASRFSPMVRIFEGFYIDNTNRINNNMSIKEILVYIIICVALYFISKLIYNKRKLEAASQTIVFKSVQYILRYGITFCSMLVGGLYFQGAERNIHWMFFGFIIASLIGYLIAEMIIKKSLWVFRSIKGYVIYVVVMIVLMLGINFDVIGYESKVPSLDKVSSIYFSNSGYNLNYEKYNSDKYFDGDNLNNILELHKQIIKGKELNKYANNRQGKNIVIVYDLKDGSKLKRQYSISNEDYSKYLKSIYESKEYKKNNYDILGVDPLDVEKIAIHPSLKIDKQAVIIKPEDIKEAIEVIKQDINSETYENMNTSNASWAEMTLMISENKLKKYPKLDENNREQRDKQIHVSWEKSYKLFEEWLKKKGYLENSRVLPKDISYVVVEKVQNSKQIEEKINGKLLNEKDVKKLEITDKNQIETCLRNYNHPFGKYGESNGKYIIGFYGEDKSNIEYGTFSEKDVPDFVKSYLNK
jgi:hypothetical protein